MVPCQPAPHTAHPSASLSFPQTEGQDSLYSRCQTLVLWQNTPERSDRGKQRARGGSCYLCVCTEKQMKPGRNAAAPGAESRRRQQCVPPGTWVKESVCGGPGTQQSLMGQGKSDQDGFPWTPRPARAGHRGCSHPGSQRLTPA